MGFQKGTFMNETITIPTTEYNELLMIKEHYEAQASIKNKIGPAWNKYQELIALDKFCSDMYPSYQTMKKEFKTKQKYLISTHVI